MISPAINQKRKSESDVLEAEAQKDALKQKEPQKSPISSPLQQTSNYTPEQPVADMTQMPQGAISRLDPQVQQYYRSKIPTSPLQSGDPMGSLLGLRHQHVAQKNLQTAESQARQQYEDRFDVKHPYLNAAKNVGLAIGIPLALQAAGASGLLGAGMTSAALKYGGKISPNQAKLGRIADFGNIAKRSQHVVGKEGLGTRVGIPTSTALLGKEGAKGMPSHLAANNRMNAIIGMTKAPRLSNVKMNIAGVPLSLANLGSLSQIKDLPQFAKIKASDVYDQIQEVKIPAIRSKRIKDQVINKLRRGISIPAPKEAKESLESMIKTIPNLDLSNEKDLVRYKQQISHLERDPAFSYYRDLFSGISQFLKGQLSRNNQLAVDEADKAYAGYKLLSSILDKSNKTGDIDIVKMARSLNTKQRDDLNSALRLLGMNIEEGAEHLEGVTNADKFIDYLTKSFVKERLSQGENAVNLTPLITSLKAFQGKSSIPWLQDILDALTIINTHQGSATSSSDRGSGKFDKMGNWMLMSTLQQAGLDTKSSMALAYASDVLSKDSTESGIEALVEEIGTEGLSDLTKILSLNVEGKNYGILGDVISYLRKLLSGANNG